MRALNEKIAQTIEVPQFLKSNTVNPDITIDLVFSILDTYFRAVTNDFKDDDELLKLGLTIDHLSSDLTDLTLPQTNLQCWLWIGETVTKWIDIAIEDECYEAATNLRKLLNNEYV